MNKIPLYVSAFSLLCGAATVVADEEAELLKLKNTTINLIEALVSEGILSRERADELMADANRKAEEQAAAEERKEAVKQDVVRVPYVPEFVKDEIRDEVRASLREEVVGDVMSQARTERWGVPGALPEWTSKVKVSGDIRLRWQSDLFDGGNVPNAYPDFQEINDGGFTGNPDQFFNTTEDRHRARARVRLGITGKVANNIKIGVRLASGNQGDPVSTNETLSTSDGRWDLAVDRAYLEYQGYDLDSYNWLTFTGGRIPNPFFSTDLVWDRDLNFDGAATTLRYSLSGSNDLYDVDEEGRSIYLTLGAFPLEEVDLSSRDKWLYAAQLGAEWLFKNQSKFKFGIAYYNYENIVGQRNELNSVSSDFTAPEFVQKGNSLFEISNPTNQRLFALASDFDIINVTASYDIARFAPTHVVLSADYAQNIGYDSDDVRRRASLGGLFTPSGPGDDPFKERNEAYQVKLMVGWPQLRKRRDWQVFGAWKHIERDSVLDAFTDSDFHLGGTDAEGWILGGGYGVANDTWVILRWLSSDEIDGDKLAVDTIQLDLNSRF